MPPVDIESLVARCRGVAPDPTAFEELGRQRRELAGTALRPETDPAALEGLLNTIGPIAVSGLPPSPDCEPELAAVRAALMNGTNTSAPALIAAMTLAPAHMFPTPPSITPVPEFLRLPYVLYLLASPVLFTALGEMEAFARHRTKTMRLLHTAVFAEHISKAHLVAQFAAAANNTMLYFNSSNLRPYFRDRAELLELVLRSQSAQLHYSPPLNPRPRPRIGFLHTHIAPSTEAYHLLAFLEGRESAAETTLYICDGRDSPLEPVFASLVDKIVRLPPQVMRAVERIRADDLDMLLTSANITYDASHPALIAAHRLARTQVTMAASPVTTGYSNPDLFLSGTLHEPAADPQDEYEENLLTRTDSIAYYGFAHDTQPQTQSFSRAALGIGEAQIVFFSAANYYKIVPEVAEVWARILAAVPEACLILMPYNPNWSSAYPAAIFERRWAAQLREAGISPSRVIIRGRVPARADLKALMQVADIYLDSFPFSGACSLIDPLQLGLPVVAMDGTTFRGAIAGSILRHSRLEWMLCSDAEGYVARALHLAANPDARRREAQEIREKTSPLPCLETTGFARKVFRSAEGAIAGWTDRAQAFRAMPVQALRDRIRHLASMLRKNGNSAYAQLTDMSLIGQLLEPYLKTLRAEEGNAGKVVDVGACVGKASLPFLRAGWAVDMFEPDPECRAALQEICAKFPGARLLATAITSSREGPVTFHKRPVGLSGLEPSPFAGAGEDISVPGTTLSRFYENERPRIDLLKIDAEGLDLEILDHIDLRSLAPKVVMLEFGTAFAKQPAEAVNLSISRMSAAGYDVAGFQNAALPGFGVSNWACKLFDITFGDVGPFEGAPGMGNLIFYRKGETTFLVCLLLLLESFQPARQRQWGMQWGL